VGFAGRVCTYICVGARRAIQWWGQAPRSCKRWHVYISANVFPEAARLPSPLSHVVVAPAAVLRDRRVERRKWLRHGEIKVARTMAEEKRTEVDAGGTSVQVGSK
jgi:hypothetical protein